MASTSHTEQLTETSDTLPLEEQLQRIDADIEALTAMPDADMASVRQLLQKRTAMKKEADEETKRRIRVMAQREKLMTAGPQTIDTKLALEEAAVKAWRDYAADITWQKFYDHTLKYPGCELPGKWEFAGALLKRVAEIEELVTTPAAGTGREAMKLVYLRNPPRHGKSLALEMLFRENPQVTKIIITYNNSTTLLTDEVESFDGAVKQFWTRVALALCASKNTVMNRPPAVPLSSWQSVEKAFPQLLQGNVLLAVDELSKLLRKATWCVTSSSEKFGEYFQLERDPSSPTVGWKVSDALRNAGDVSHWVSKRIARHGEKGEWRPANSLQDGDVVDLASAAITNDHRFNVVASHIYSAVEIDLELLPVHRTRLLQNFMVVGQKVPMGTKLEFVTYDSRYLFFSQLTPFQHSATAPFRRMVITGFDDAPQIAIAGSGFSVETLFIPQVSHVETTRLARRILWAYANNQAEGPFPMYLFYLLKCSPGLMGTWAMQTMNDRKYARTLQEFRERDATWANDLLYKRAENMKLVEAAFYGTLTPMAVGQGINNGIFVPREPSTSTTASSTVLPRDTISIVPYAMAVLLLEGTTVVETEERAAHITAPPTLESLLRDVMSCLEEHAAGEPSNWRHDARVRLSAEAKAAHWWPPTPPKASTGSVCVSCVEDGEQDRREEDTAPLSAEVTAAVTTAAASTETGVVCRRVKPGDCFEKFVARAVRLAVRCKLHPSSRDAVNLAHLLPNTNWFNVNVGGETHSLPLIALTGRADLERLLTQPLYDLFPLRIHTLLDGESLAAAVELRGSDAVKAKWTRVTDAATPGLHRARLCTEVAEEMRPLPVVEKSATMHQVWTESPDKLKWETFAEGEEAAWRDFLLRDGEGGPFMRKTCVDACKAARSPKRSNPDLALKFEEFLKTRTVDAVKPDLLRLLGWKGGIQLHASSLSETKRTTLLHRRLFTQLPRIGTFLQSFPCASDDEMPESVDAFLALCADPTGIILQVLPEHRRACDGRSVPTDNAGCDVVVVGEADPTTGKRLVLFVEVKDRRGATSDDWNAKIDKFRHASVINSDALRSKCDFVVVLAGRTDAMFIGAR